jgi:hypothetical protein
LISTDASAPYSFDWTGVAAGTYSITAVVTDNAGGTATSTAVTVVVSTVTHVDDYDASNGIALYPNPSNSGFYLQLPELSKVKVMNIQGVTLEEMEGTGELYFGDKYASGIYLVEISTGNRTVIKRASKK